MAESLMALAALTAMEIVLGIDNIVFITILTGRLPEAQRTSAFRLGLGLALVSRLILLMTLTWILGLEKPVFTLESLGLSEEWMHGVFNGSEEHPASWAETWQHINEVSWRDIILFIGGLFLVGKSVREIHHSLEGGDGHHETPQHANFIGVLIQIAVLDIIFSLDSVITAVGMVRRDKMWVMVTAIVLAIGVMVIFASRIGEFVHHHPTLKMLALSFLILIGVVLIADGMGTELSKGYIYFTMAFALIVEVLNMRIRSKHIHRIVAT